MLDTIKEIQRLTGKKIVLFPEYHLSNFPPQRVFTVAEVAEFVHTLTETDTDIIIAGYVETDDQMLYSSCIIKDNNKVFNIRKKYPYRDEMDIISPASSEYRPVPLSIGNSYFFMCNDVTQEIKQASLGPFIKEKRITFLFLISAMERNFEQWLNKLVHFAQEYHIEAIFYCDRFNGKGIKVIA